MTWNTSVYDQIQQMKIPILIICGIAILLIIFAILISWANKKKESHTLMQNENNNDKGDK